DTHHWMDGIGGEGNFTDVGSPHNDTDIYGNRVTFAWDDGIEMEGADINVRAWGNYVDHTYTALATACVNNGPIYIWRNVYDRSLQKDGPNDSTDHGPFGKLGDGYGYGGGRRYYFHNTLLQRSPPAGQTLGQGAGDG